MKATKKPSVPRCTKGLRVLCGPAAEHALVDKYQMLHGTDTTPRGIGAQCGGMLVPKVGTRRVDRSAWQSSTNRPVTAPESFRCANVTVPLPTFVARCPPCLPDWLPH